MATNRSNTANPASGWLGSNETSDWLKRLGDGIRNVFDAVDTGLKASHDYRRLAARVPVQQATAMVFQKYYGKR